MINILLISDNISMSTNYEVDNVISNIYGG